MSAPDPDRFSYVPGMGVACMPAGDQILVGNRALLLDRKLDPSECPEPGRELSEVLVARSGKLLGAIRIADYSGRSVAMVGDGVNDAPALVEANVGVAMGSNTDVAMESASVVLLGNDLTRLVETVRIARRCRRIVFQNFAGTLAGC